MNSYPSPTTWYVPDKEDPTKGKWERFNVYDPFKVGCGSAPGVADFGGEGKHLCIHPDLRAWSSVQHQMSGDAIAEGGTETAAKAQLESTAGIDHAKPQDKGKDETGGDNVVEGAAATTTTPKQGADAKSDSESAPAGTTSAGEEKGSVDASGTSDEAKEGDNVVEGAAATPPPKQGAESESAAPAGTMTAGAAPVVAGGTTTSDGKGKEEGSTKEPEEKMVEKPKATSLFSGLKSGLESLWSSSKTSGALVQLQRHATTQHRVMRKQCVMPAG